MDKTTFEYLEKAYGELPISLDDVIEEDGEKETEDMLEDYEDAVQLIRKTYEWAAKKYGFKAIYA